MSERLTDAEAAFADTSDEAVAKSIAVCRLNAQAAPNLHIAGTQLGIAGTLAMLLAERREIREALARLRALHDGDGHAARTTREEVDALLGREGGG